MSYTVKKYRKKTRRSRLNLEMKFLFNLRPVIMISTI